eukprot:NODE_7873_length_415_cov_176.883333.p5 GENE.NODE_7873_length_415_cov_176.883333~~NODE_7873_length_415_cov_176.883333.p5  ORF type:complete len:50 (+),score=0.50 NODE_7873_length_415_cov_176.883333:237-386(+)
MAELVARARGCDWSGEAAWQWAWLSARPWGRAGIVSARGMAARPARHVV